MHSSVLILWTILPLVFQSSNTGVVHQLYSSTSIVGRTHGCVGELLTFTCTTSGRWMKWEITHKAQANPEPLQFHFIQLDPVNKVLSDSRFDDITAILLENYNISSSEANFTSVVFIKLTKNSLPGNITCTSTRDNATRTLQYSIAETPQPPELTQITLLGIPSPEANNSLLYRLQWAKPPNVESFDLDHYELIVGNPTMNHTTKVDAGENAAIFLLVMKHENGTVVAHIRAVDRCGKESNLISSKLPISGLTPSSGLNSTSFTSCNCACIKKLVPSVIVTSIVTATIAIISVALVLIVLRQKQRCPTIFTTVNTKVDDQQASDHYKADTVNNGKEDQEANNDESIGDHRAENVTVGPESSLLVEKIKRHDLISNYGRQRSSSTASYQRIPNTSQ